MSQKVNITEKVMSELGLDIDSENVKEYSKIWWKNKRSKKKGGLWLTPLGFEAFKRAKIKFYTITLKEKIESFENKFIIWLDNCVDCPFYLEKSEIFVFGERTAIQMILFEGDLLLWHKHHIKSKALSI